MTEGQKKAVWIVFIVFTVANIFVFIDILDRDLSLHGTCTDEVISIGMGGKCWHKSQKLEERPLGFVCRCTR